MLRIRTSVWVCLVSVSLLTVAAAGPAHAQARAGIQGGVSLDPDQFFFGGHIETTPLVDRVRFRPGVDIGLGDDLTVVAINLDFTYSFTESRPWNLYVGGGPAINWIDFDGGSDTEGGFNLIVGAKSRERVFFEMKIGLIDSPELKFGVGYTFR